MSGRRRVVYDTRFIAAMYSPKNDDERSKIRHELTTTLSRYISSLTIYETYKISLETEDKQTADLRDRDPSHVQLPSNVTVIPEFPTIPPILAAFAAIVLSLSIMKRPAHVRAIRVGVASLFL